MFLGFHDNFRLAVLINFVLIKKNVSRGLRHKWSEEGTKTIKKPCQIEHPKCS